jgi:asparagine synthase (glutamine-hydrolysing)
MHSANRRFILTLNGEIYNFADIRSELEQQGHAPLGGWRSHGDSEVLLEAISTWGVEAALARSSGMFAFALWDRQQRRLTLVRDRFGEKPLYYGWAGTAFVFASELKALSAHPKFDNSINRESVALLLARNYVPAPLSIFERIYKLPAGCVLDLNLSGATSPRDVPPEIGVCAGGLRLGRYWSYRDVVERGLAAPIIDEQEALDQLDETLSASVRRQSVADVPVGAFLSGGIDSSLIVALKLSDSSTPLRTYSIGFRDPAYNEAHQARETAEFLGTVHHEEYVTPEQSLDVIQALPSIFDEPFADASQIPTHILSRLAATDVKVALTGDGGDELFAGYYHHFLAPRVWSALQALPRPLLQPMISSLSRVSPHVWEQVAGLFAKRKQGHIGLKIQKALRAAGRSNDLDDVHQALMEEWERDSFPLLGTFPHDLNSELSLGGTASATDRMLFRDAVSYLPDDILCKVDRASMAASLETRVPFLDHSVAELAARIPISMKVQNGHGKSILRKVIRRYLPDHLVDRPKNGFAVPIGEWLKGALRPWAEDVLDVSRMRHEGWLDAKLVSTRWREHLEGNRDATGAIWSVLMFNSWLRTSAESRLSTVTGTSGNAVGSFAGGTYPNLAISEQRAT